MRPQFFGKMMFTVAALVVLALTAQAIAAAESVAPCKAGGYSPEEAATWVADPANKERATGGLMKPLGYDSLDEVVTALEGSRASTYGPEFGNRPAKNSGFTGDKFGFGNPKPIANSVPVLLLEDGQVLKATCLNELEVQAASTGATNRLQPSGVPPATT